MLCYPQHVSVTYSPLQISSHAGYNCGSWVVQMDRSINFFSLVTPYVVCYAVKARPEEGAFRLDSAPTV